MRRPFRSERAFTLIELLTVIAIIAVLIGLLFPAIKHALLQAEITKSKVQISNLETAFKSYYTEYGHWPVADATGGIVNSNNTYIVDTNMVALLQGLRNTQTLTALAPGAFTYPSAIGAYNAMLQDNPHAIPFLSLKQAEVTPAGYIDPWQHPYFCRFDVSYVNQVADPFTATAPGVALNNVNNGFVIWSAGPDGQFDNTGDVPPSTVNKDNVKNW